MDVLVTDISVTGHFGNLHFSFIGSGQWLWSIFNTGYAGSKSVYALAGQSLLA